MPWHIGTSDECPASKPYAVIKDSDDSVAGCHETREKAEKQMAALYANEGKAVPNAKPIKAEQISGSKWRVLAIPFGGPKDGKDTDEQFFSPRTDIKAHWFHRRPTIWHHNLDKTMKADSEIGTEELDDEYEDDGWWGTIWLDRAHQYWSRIDKWLHEGKVYGSSGTMGHFMEYDHKTGEILVWPHVEQTLTLTPANPYARVTAVKALAHFNAAGIAVDEDIISRLLAGPPDLGPDLPQGGEDPAMERLGATLDQLTEVLRRLRS